MPQEAGFELTFPDDREAEFFPFVVGMSGAKDLKIIDYCTMGMPLDEFASALEDPVARNRGTIMLAMMGTSIRAQHPDWTVERIAYLIDEIDLNDVEFLKGEEDSNGADPLLQEPKPAPDESSSGSQSEESESSATPTEPSVLEPTPSTSEPSSETPA
jgi:hypothetical protein